MDTFDYLFCKARENGKVAKALSEKLQTDVDKNNLVYEIGNIDVGAIVQAIVKGTGVALRDIVDTASNISGYKYSNNVNINAIDYVNAKSVGVGAMNNCMSLTSVNMPSMTSVGDYAMQNCMSLTSVNMPSVTSVGVDAMKNCMSLKSVRLGANQVCTLVDTNAFLNTPIANGTGYIYVPDELVEDYKVATNWSVYADQIRPMSEYVEE